MEFHISLRGATPALEAIDDVLRREDPSALVDIDPDGSVMRLATSLDAVQLVSLVQQAGWPITADQVRQLPSICCGGCSG
jgi:hypothetical protein